MKNFNPSSSAPPNNSKNLSHPLLYAGSSLPPKELAAKIFKALLDFD